MTDINIDLELAKLRSLIEDARDAVGAERPGGWENMPMWGGGADFSDYALGFSIAGDEVSFNAGEIQHGTNIYNVSAKASVTISNTLSYMWVDYTNWTSGVIAGPSTSRPISTPTHTMVWLALFAVSGGTVTVSQVGHIGNIIIPSIYAP